MAKGTRRLARERALQLLYSLEYSQKSFEETEQDFLRSDAKRRKSYGSFARELASRTHERRRELDAEIAPVLENWPIERLATMDRLCLRMAVCELKFFPDIPRRVTINECIEMAKIYGSEDSPKYVNGVIDKISRAYPHKDFEASPEEKGDEDEGAEAPDEQGASPQA